MPSIKLSLKVDSPPPFELHRAVLIYRQGEHGKTFTTVHDAGLVEGRPGLMQGRALTPAMSRQLAILASRQRTVGSYLPANVLMVDGDQMIWYEPPQVRHLAFLASDLFPKRSLGTRGGKVPVPGVIFVAGPRRWQVYAVKGTERPTPETALWHAPFYNVDAQDGRICVGNVKLPQGTTVELIAAWNRAFFGTYFPHANYDGVVAYKGDATALWRDLLDGKFSTTFPEEVLKPHGYTLNDLIKHLAR